MKVKRFLAIVVMAALLFAAVPAVAQSARSQTPLGSSSESKRFNIDLACGTLNGWIILQGETFSFNEAVGPRTKENGYLNAENGRGVKVRGGGVAQVATTLYLAVRELDAVSIDYMRTYGNKFTDGYVDDPADAVLVDYSAGTDFTFTNNGEALALYMWTDENKVYCSVEPARWEGDGNIIGFAQTYVDGTKARVSNIKRSAESISGTILQPGQEFSFNDAVGPRTGEYGYQSAINGRGVKVMGGGVAQVASTLYLAVKDLDCITVTYKKTYGDKYNQDYVDDPDDAIVTDYSAGTDFTFRNDGSVPLEIFFYIDSDNMLCCMMRETFDSWFDGYSSIGE